MVVTREQPKGRFLLVNSIGDDDDPAGPYGGSGHHETRKKTLRQTFSLRETGIFLLFFLFHSLFLSFLLLSLCTRLLVFPTGLN